MFVDTDIAGRHNGFDKQVQTTQHNFSMSHRLEIAETNIEPQI